MAGATNLRYIRDSTDRIIARQLAGTTTARYGHTGGGDTPDFATDANGTVTETYTPLLGGALVTHRPGSGVEVWSHPNIHGDTAATTDATGTKTGSTHTYDPYGQPLAAIPDNATGNHDWGWLGQHQRGLEHQTGIHTIEMGARQYHPGLGRFLQTDPIEGGTENDYVYPSDPVNMFDPDGRCGRAGTAWLPCGGRRPYTPPKGAKGKPQKVKGRNAWVDDRGNEWEWDNKGKHWDVQHKKSGKHTNVRRDGEIHHGPDNFPNRPGVRYQVVDAVRDTVSRWGSSMGDFFRGGCSGGSLACTR